MGRVRTSKYALKMRFVRPVEGGFQVVETSECWKGPLPTLKKLEHHVMSYVVSTMTGFANEHIGEQYGIQIPSVAAIIRNDGSGERVLVWKAPLFQVLPEAKDYPAVAKSFRAIIARQNTEGTI